MEYIKLVENGRYKCSWEHCKSSFSRYDNAIQHFREQHENRRKDCTVCGKRLKIKNYARHVQSHKKNKIKKVKVNCALHFHEDGRIFSDVIDVKGKKFALIPVGETEIKNIEVGGILRGSIIEENEAKSMDVGVGLLHEP